MKGGGYKHVGALDIKAFIIRTFLEEGAIFCWAKIEKEEVVSMKKIAVISAILEEPGQCQQEFNSLISSFKGIVKGRMGIPFEEEKIAVVSLTVVGELDEINSLTGKLGNIPRISVKTAISKREI